MLVEYWQNDLKSDPINVYLAKFLKPSSSSKMSAKNIYALRNFFYALFQAHYLSKALSAMFQVTKCFLQWNQDINAFQRRILQAPETENEGTPPRKEVCS